MKTTHPVERQTRSSGALQAIRAHILPGGTGKRDDIVASGTRCSSANTRGCTIFESEEWAAPWLVAGAAVDRNAWGGLRHTSKKRAKFQTADHAELGLRLKGIHERDGACGIETLHDRLHTLVGGIGGEKCALFWRHQQLNAFDCKLIFRQGSVDSRNQPEQVVAAEADVKRAGAACWVGRAACSRANIWAGGWGCLTAIKLKL